MMNFKLGITIIVLVICLVISFAVYMFAVVYPANITACANAGGARFDMRTSYCWRENGTRIFLP